MEGADDPVRTAHQQCGVVTYPPCKEIARRRDQAAWASIKPLISKNPTDIRREHAIACIEIPRERNAATYLVNEIIDVRGNGRRRFHGCSRIAQASEEYALRLGRGGHGRLRLDAVVVSAPENVLYLSGYQTRAVFTFQILIVHKSRPLHLVARQMEIANAQRACRVDQLKSFTVYQYDEARARGLRVRHRWQAATRR
jgi:hypothetical protein